MLVKAEIFEGNAMLLGDDGRIWQINAKPGKQAEVRLVACIGGELVRELSTPNLAQFALKS